MTPAVLDRAADTAALLADASAARTIGGQIGVHLTPFAPGCQDLAIGHPDRWRVYQGRSLETVLRSVLTRLARAAGDVAAEDCPAGGVDLTARIEGAPRPLAVIFEGAGLAAVAETLATLARRRWSPEGANPLEH